jgi:hypothetical protein
MGNEYKMTPYKVGPISICEIIKKDEFYYPGIHAASENFPPLETCDFKKGQIYSIKNYLPNLERVPPVISSGDYMIDCQVSREKELIQGVKVYAQIFNIMSGK